MADFEKQFEFTGKDGTVYPITVTIGGVDVGVDATGAPAGQGFTPIDTTTWQKKDPVKGLFFPALLPPAGSYQIKTPNGTIVFVSNNWDTFIPAYWEIDKEKSLGYYFRQQFPHVPCSERY
jgi:hypothetical protein